MFNKPDPARVQQTRSAFTADMFERPKVDRWSPSAILTTPPETDGYKFRWIREFIYGQYDDASVSGALNEGYIPVHQSDMPMLMPNMMVQPSEDGAVRRGGLVLMKIPSEFARQRQEHYARKSQEAKHHADALQGVNPDPRMPVFSEDKSRTLEGGKAVLSALQGSR